MQARLVINNANEVVRAFITGKRLSITIAPKYPPALNCSASRIFKAKKPVLLKINAKIPIMRNDKLK